MHHDEIDRPEWDQPRRPAPPDRRVAICTTPRSGSYLLCRQMIHAGLGLPAEYFRDWSIRPLAARWGAAAGDDDAYIDELEARRTSANGVFAAKVQWHHLKAHPRVRERLLARADLVVFLYRRDVVAQAVSWQVSLATGFWSFDATPGPKAPDASLDDPGLTLGLANELARQNRAWQELLRTLGRKVLAVPYESYVTGQSELLSRIAADLALPDGAWTLPPSEPRDGRLPDDVEAARARLLAQARAALPAPTGA
ncbi:hypothetical protein BURK1_02353 [Burkholderiales bacterium]|nr:hypothetical protein BURK1_02353 [Burkholderiales bacterium]